MRALHQLTKRENEPLYYPLDFNPWLQSIGSTFGTVVVGNAPDISESYEVSLGVIKLTLTGGNPGYTYRLPVTVTAANNFVRSTVIEVLVLGVQEATSGGGSGVVGAGNVDGGGPDTNYTSTDPIDGGTP